MHVYIIGTGPGNPALLTGQAKAAIEASPILVGDKRMLAPFAVSGKRLVATYRRDDICQLAASLSDEEGPMAILVSGDVGFFSLAALLTDIPGCTVTRIAGISSLVYFAAALQTTWNDAFIVSRHGRRESLVAAVRQHRKVFVLTGGSDSPAALCRELCQAGLDMVSVAIGCDLSYDNENILRGTAADFTDRPADSLAVMMVENEKARPWVRPVHGLPDEAFLRGKAPMTKQEIRSIALSRLAPSPDAVVYDIGAGTGSCTVELALLVPMGEVFAFEIDDEQVGGGRLFHARQLADDKLADLLGQPHEIALAPKIGAELVGEQAVLRERSALAVQVAERALGLRGDVALGGLVPQIHGHLREHVHAGHEIEHMQNGVVDIHRTPSRGKRRSFVIFKPRSDQVKL